MKEKAVEIPYYTVFILIAQGESTWRSLLLLDEEDAASFAPCDGASSLSDVRSIKLSLSSSTSTTFVAAEIDEAHHAIGDALQFPEECCALEFFSLLLVLKTGVHE